MFEHFSERTRQTILLAVKEARRLGHGYVGTEHLLVGVIHQADNVAAEFLSTAGVTLDQAREVLERLVERGTTPTSDPVPLSTGAKRTMELAFVSRSEGNPLVEPEHMVLATLWHGLGHALEMLSELGVNPTALREAISTTTNTSHPTALIYVHQPKLLRRRTCPGCQQPLPLLVRYGFGSKIRTQRSKLDSRRRIYVSDPDGFEWLAHECEPNATGAT